MTLSSVRIVQCSRAVEPGAPGSRPTDFRLQGPCVLPAPYVLGKCRQSGVAQASQGTYQHRQGCLRPSDFSRTPACSQASLVPPKDSVRLTSMPLASHSCQPQGRGAGAWGDGVCSAQNSAFPRRPQPTRAGCGNETQLPETRHIILPAPGCQAELVLNGQRGLNAAFSGNCPLSWASANL